MSAQHRSDSKPPDHPNGGNISGPSVTQPAAKEPLSHREALLVVFGVLVPVLMGSLDQSIVATALPTIGRDLGYVHYLPWVVAIYLLTMTAATPLYGRISDSIGRQITLIAAIIIFMVGGIASALADSMAWLIAARAIQGIGTGGLVSLAMTVLGDVATPKQRARYYTYFSITYTTSGALGPLLGGYLAEFWHWSAVFWVGVPLGSLSLLLALTLLRKLPRNERRRKIDMLGAILIVAASSTTMFAVNAGGKTFPWTSPQILGAACVSLLFWFAFVYRLLTAAEPLIPLGLFRNQIVRTSTIANAIGWGSIIGLTIYLPLYLQAVLGLSPTSAGLHMMVLLVTINTSALVGAQIAARAVHYKRYPMATLAISIVSLVYLTWRLDQVSTWEFEIVLAIFGIGFGPLAPVTTVSAQNAVALSQLGTTTSMQTFTRSLYASMLVAALGAVILHALSGSGSAASDLIANRDAAIVAFRLMFIITTAGLCIALFAFWRMEEKPLLASNEGRG